MINFIYGTFGSGKTSAVLDRIKNDTANGICTFLIVPDQEALQFERLSLSCLPASSQLRLEILGFSRLYNRVCRENGSLTYSYITKPMRSLLMWRSLRELSPLLENYKGEVSSDISFSDTVLNSVNELMASGVTPASLEIASRKLPGGSSLSERLRDISLIYSCYDNFVTDKYGSCADELSRLCDMIKDTDFFHGKNVYIDSFFSYSGIEHSIISEIFRSADNVTITVPLSSPTHSDISTAGIKSSLERLRDDAKRFGGYFDMVLGESKRSKSNALANISEHFWELGKDSGTPEYDGSIMCEVCSNRYTESEAVTAHILELLRNGCRCRDIAIITGNADNYRGILDVALRKSGIPCFMSEKSELCSMPPVKFLLSALKIKKYNWQKRDVISFLKTGLCDLENEEICLFEEYVNTWNINGARLAEGNWTMNPDGFTAQISPRSEKILSSANKVQKYISESLLKFFILLDASNDIPEMCKAVFSYLEESQIDGKLSALAARAAENGVLKEARQLSKLYEIILNTLADIAVALDGEEADTEEFILILRAAFEKTAIADIPTSVDEIMIGSASSFRAFEPKYVFAVGLCEGEFPAASSDEGLFSESDRAALADLGIELSNNAETLASNGMFYVAKAFASPSVRLYAFTHRAEIGGKTCFPSLAFERLKKLFPKMKVHEFDPSDLDYLVPSLKNAVSLVRSMKDERSKLSLVSAIGKFIPEFSLRSSVPTSTGECKVSPDIMSNLLGRSLHMSSSAFEKYVKCPFDYFCGRILSLREKATSRFDYNDMGSFVHYILEILIKECIPQGSDEPPISDEELIKKTDAAVESYLKEICPEELLNSNRLRHLYERLKQLSLLLVRNAIREFSQSDFRPAFFELRADGKGGRPAPLLFSLNGNVDVSFTGVIDRVDIYRKDGQVYIRIIDYKTGAKVFSSDDISHGINLQMLIYLFTLCRNGSSEFKTAIGLDEDKEPIPSGVIYLSAAIPSVDASDYISVEDVLSKAEKELVRTGLLLNDRDILTAMNKQLDAEFLAGIKENKQGQLYGSALTSLSGFADIYDSIEKTVKDTVSELYGGRADASPLDYGKDSPCKYCNSRPVCRRANDDSEDI